MSNSEFMTETKKSGIIVAIIVALIAGGVVFLGSQKPANPNVAKCELEIKNKLKSPSSAQIAFDDEIGIVLTGSVDSQNSYGEILRSRF
jgi:hypothetical protein